MALRVVSDWDWSMAAEEAAGLGLAGLFGVFGCGCCRVAGCGCCAGCGAAAAWFSQGSGCIRRRHWVVATEQAGTAVVAYCRRRNCWNCGRTGATLGWRETTSLCLPEQEEGGQYPRLTLTAMTSKASKLESLLAGAVRAAAVSNTGTVGGCYHRRASLAAVMRHCCN